MTDASGLPAADRFGTNDPDNPYWNENSWFSVSIPEERIHGLIQHFFRPQMNVLVGGPVLWDPERHFQWNCLHYQWSHLQAIPEGAQKFDLKARNSLSVKVVEPLQSYKIDYDRDGLVMDLSWEAIGPFHQMVTGNPDQEAVAAFHGEQPGRMTGTITRHGKTWQIDCWSMRDCSTGPYDVDPWPTGGYFWGIGPTDDKGGVGAFLTMCMGKARANATMGGFLMRDGKTGTLVEGKRTVLEYGQFGPSKVLFEGRDDLGREIRAEGTIDPGLVHTGYTDHTVIWSLEEWKVDGQTWWGDNQEFFPSEDYRRLMRGELSFETMFT